MDHYADDDRKECIPCDPECRSCFAEGPGGCVQCRNFKVIINTKLNIFIILDKLSKNHCHFYIL